MEFIYNKIFLEHDTGTHPENKARLESFNNLHEMSVRNGEKHLSLIHTNEYIKHVEKSCRGGIALDPDTLTSPRSYQAAVHAVGATITASENNDFALVRPPGHHAYPHKAAGFCLFNNVAIATKKLVQKGKKALIFDFDGHLGDGTMNIFYPTDEVLYFSLHQFPAFPGRVFADTFGEGNGKGYSIPIDLPPGSCDDVFWEAIDRFFPIVEQFKPDVVGVSAGFDAHMNDPLLNLGLSANSYYKLGKMLANKFSNVFAALEGGYNTEIFPKCVNNFLDGFNDKTIQYKEQETESDLAVRREFEDRADRLEKNLSEFWKMST